MSVPFIQQRHGSPHDFFRYTPDGLRSIFRKFKELECGATGSGPVGTWAEMTVAIFSGLARNKIISYALRFSLGWILYPIALTDKLFRGRMNDFNVVGGSCYLGRK